MPWVREERLLDQHTWLIGESAEKIIQEYPASTYVGWSLLYYKLGVVGVLGKNPNAIEAVNSAITRDYDKMKQHWRGYNPASEDQYHINKRKDMEDLVRTTELFVDKNKDFDFAGWLSARAGYSALALGDFKRACKLLKSSQESPWRLPGGDLHTLSQQEMVKQALSMLNEHELCD